MNKQKAITEVDKLIAAIPAGGSRDAEGIKALQNIIDANEEATFNLTPKGGWIDLCGIRVSSAGGPILLLRTWQEAARA